MYVFLGHKHIANYEYHIELKYAESYLIFFFKLPDIHIQWVCFHWCNTYLRIATVRASGELAQGQMTSCLRPLLWKTLRNASQEEMDPGVKKKKIITEKTNLISEVMLLKLQIYCLIYRLFRKNNLKRILVHWEIHHSCYNYIYIYV